MSHTDKSKLDGIAAGAQVNVGTNLSYSTASTTGTVNSSTGNNATIPAATTSLAGLLTGADKTKLNGIAAGAQVNVGTNLGTAVVSTNSRSITSSTGNNITVPVVTTTVAGFMSHTDKSKLDGIETGATADQTITAGNGLTGGGTGNVTLNVGAGSGISVAADTVAVNSTVIRTTGNQTIGGTKTFSTDVFGTNFILSSDRRLKSDIIELNGGLDLVSKLKPMEYIKSENKEFGFITDEIPEELDFLVKRSGEYEALDYISMIGILVKSVQELKTELDTIKKNMK